MISFHYRSPEETGWRGSNQPSTTSSATRHRPQSSTWNQVSSYTYYTQRRNDFDSASSDNKHLRSLIARRHFGCKRLDRADQQTPLLFFLERGIGTQLHGHLLIPQPLPGYDNVNALTTDWKGYISTHAKCLSRQRPAHVLQTLEAPAIIGYLTKETRLENLSLDVMASNFLTHPSRQATKQI